MGEKARAILSETAVASLEEDLAELRPSRKLIVCGEWEVYIVKRGEIPNVLQEIVRLRELVVNAIAQPLARYDDNQQHLFLYNRQSRQLVGACRVGPGRVVLRQHGNQGFYLHSLFRWKKKLTPLLRESLEIGGSFIRAEYRNQELPVVLLWKGLAAYLSSHSEYSYLISSVSVSPSFLPASKAFVANFIRQYYFDAERAVYVHTRKQFRYHPLQEQRATQIEMGLDQVEALHNLVADLQPGGMYMPTSLRHYLRQNARFLGLNINTVSNSLDGFLVLNARKLPEHTYRLLA
ncbi:GNAT family N-acetyltransferase [Hymenobacter cavernae]|uniref:GNAT family N-acetyltransferase n=1 Tax=Hymenobacter cavernae TaxID=2044852 RepID=UPI001E50939C|nr:GNAT family N-acetyltransferase [Hymenobacter cavernae]